ncbi:hypothetical protein [Desulfosediminicola flagellatus]|uniref:hypothetical protein n=1 Tax=Desulfosediminicola flagellatus TaxID=2569541 RepID=UPI0010AC2D7B|nr:hypothetical protein [Desulfosediminicola flagellatus]
MIEEVDERVKRLKEYGVSPILRILSGDNRGDEESLHWAVVFHVFHICPNALQPDAHETQVGKVNFKAWYICTNEKGRGRVAGTTCRV